MASTNMNSHTLYFLTIIVLICKTDAEFCPKLSHLSGILFQYNSNFENFVRKLLGINSRIDILNGSLKQARCKDHYFFRLRCIARAFFLIHQFFHPQDFQYNFFVHNLNLRFLKTIRKLTSK